TCSLPPFECAGDESCRRDGLGGFCQPRGSGRYCVFADPACPDGLRWDRSAPDEVADACFLPTCSDGIFNGVPGQWQETDIDCGGAHCPACPPGAACAVDADCDLGHCDQGWCGGYSCSDGWRNGDETS